MTPLSWDANDQTADFSPPAPREPVFVRNPEGPVWVRFRRLLDQHVGLCLPRVSGDALVAGGSLRFLYQVAAFPESFPPDLDVGALLRDHHDVDLWTASDGDVEELKQLSPNLPKKGHTPGTSEPQGQQTIKDTFKRQLAASDLVLNVIHLTEETSPEGVLKSFDLENCQVGWDRRSGEVWVTEGFEDSEARHQLRLTPTGVEAALKGYYHHSEHAIARIKKYVSRDLLTRSVHSPLFWLEHLVPWTTLALESRCLGSENIRDRIWTRKHYPILPDGVNFGFGNIPPYVRLAITPKNNMVYDIRPIWWSLHRWLLWVQENLPQEGPFPVWSRYGTTGPVSFNLHENFFHKFHEILEEEYPQAQVRLEFTFQEGSVSGYLG